MTLTTRQKISNVLTNWDKKIHPAFQEYRFAGYVEALLQLEGKIDIGSDFSYKTFTYKRMIFPGTYQVKETYPELMYRLAKEYLK